MQKTLIRTVTGVFLVGLLVLCLHLGDIVFLLIFGGFFLITIREMDSLIKAMGKEIVTTPASIFAGFFATDCEFDKKISKSIAIFDFCGIIVTNTSGKEFFDL